MADEWAAQLEQARELDRDVRPAASWYFDRDAREGRLVMPRAIAEHPRLLRPVMPGHAISGDTELRRADCLLVSWRGPSIVVHNFLAGTWTRISARVFHEFAALESFRPRHALATQFREAGCGEAVIARLVEQRLLIERGGELDCREQRLQAWRWGPEAKHFHFESKHVTFEGDPRNQGALMREKGRHHPPPPIFKDCDGERTLLPAGTPPRMRLDRVLLGRRTQREYAPAPVDFEAFSTLLRWTWGATRVIDDGTIGPAILRTSPSGGARHPIEVYPVVQRVKEVEPGLYHYSVRQHGLERIGDAIGGEHLAHLCGDQTFVRDAAVVFFMTAVVDRTMWKYDHSRAYRTLLLDAGHLGQTFQLLCTALGLAPFTTAATYDAEIEALLGLDGVGEFPLLAVAASVPAQPASQRVRS